MINREHELPSIGQAKAELQHQSQAASITNLGRFRPSDPGALMRRIDELHLELPFAGSRMLRDSASIADGVMVGRRTWSRPG